MSIELKQAAEKALFVLGSATSFMSRKARDQHESVVAELRTAIQQAEAQQPATPEPVGYMNEGHLHELAMGRLPYGYVYPEAGAGASTAVYDHPAPGVPDIEAAAKKLAECMDYPWEHMPEKGRTNMRKHAASVLTAAQARKGQP